VFIRDEDWQNLIERIIAAYANLQDLSESEQDAFRHELENAFGQPAELGMDVSNMSSVLSA
jgi:hypothetical protein